MEWVLPNVFFSEHGLNEVSLKAEKFEKDWVSFLEDLSLKKVSRIISLFLNVFFLGTEALVGFDERIDGSLQEDKNFEQVRMSNLILEQ